MDLSTICFCSIGIITFPEFIGAIKTNDSCRFRKLSAAPNGESRISPPLEKYEAALLMILGFVGLSILLAFLHKTIRKRFYGDQNSLDTVFDAGGNVSLSLTAVTVTSQQLWPADFLQSPTNAYKTGVGGALFFIIAISLVIIVFPLLSIEFKTKAPGAKTFLQIIYYRFGKPAHIVFIVIALVTNLITTTSLILGAKSALTVVVKDISNEFIVILLAMLFGSYCLIGGLGTTFYISYVNTALTFAVALVFSSYINVNSTDVPYAERSAMYEAMRCIDGPDGNLDNSLLTYSSRSGIIYGLGLFMMATSLSFCDQANWQSRIAAKPTQGVLGFFVAAFLYFALTFSLEIPIAVTYLSMSYENATHYLSDFDINNGFITPLVMQSFMGTTGGYLLITLITMALMSTGSGEVMAISSIIIYDICKIYIMPFRNGGPRTACQICGTDLLQSNNGSNPCKCTRPSECHSCIEDGISGNKKPYLIRKVCPTHGEYRQYEEYLLHLKNWCILWITLLVIPYGLVVLETDISLNWAVYFLESQLSPFLVPLLLTIVWSKATPAGVISGSILGVMAAFTGQILVAHLAYEDGLNNFFENTVGDFSVLAGCMSGFTVSSVVTIVVSLISHKIRTKEDADREWEKTLIIDNPLRPWKRDYGNNVSEADGLQSRNFSYVDMAKVFRKAKYVSVIGGGVFLVLLVIIVPVSTTTLGILSYDEFSTLFTFSFVICIVGAAFAILVPPLEEVYNIWQHRKNLRKSKTSMKRTDNVNDRKGWNLNDKSTNL